MIKPKYRIKTPEEFEILQKAYEKLIKYYDLEVDAKGLELEQGSNINKTILVYPAHPNGKITNLKRNNLEISCEVEHCKTCSLDFLENIQETYADISITGTNYLIRNKHFHYFICYFRVTFY